MKCLFFKINSPQLISDVYVTSLLIWYSGVIKSIIITFSAHTNIIMYKQVNVSKICTNEKPLTLVHITCNIMRVIWDL